MPENVVGASHLPCLQEADGIVSAGLPSLSFSVSTLLFSTAAKIVKCFVRKSEIDRVERLTEESSI